MSSVSRLFITVVLVLGCSQRGSGDVTEAGDASGHVDVRITDGEICSAECEGKECGSDGCGGVCGVCANQLHICTSEQLCKAVPCDSGEPCPGSLICDQDSGSCVACLDDSHCMEGWFCQAGLCVEMEGPCVPGHDFCSGLFDLAHCNADGTAFAAEPCPDGHYCGDAESAAQCLPWECTPDELFCQGNWVHLCNSQGAGSESLKSCSPEVCATGKCAPAVCKPDTTSCSGPSVMACDATGTVLELVETCKDDQHCATFEQGAQCIDLVCLPFEKMCSDSTVHECQQGPDGEYLWVQVDTCLEDHCVAGKCVSLCDPGILQKDYLGCDYWAVDLDNAAVDQDEPMAVVISVPPDGGQAADVTFTRMDTVPPTDMTAQELQVDSLTVEPGQGKLFMPTVPGFSQDGSCRNRKTLRISSDAPMAVHQVNPLNSDAVGSSDSSMLMPSVAAGTEYLVMSWPMRTQTYTYRGFVTIVAVAQGTTVVELVPSCKTLAGDGVPAMEPYPPQPYILELQHGEVVNVETDGYQEADLTGTLIVADKEVIVFGGHECANVPTPETNFCDHIEQQLFPVESWGTEYIGDPFAPRDDYNIQQDTWRIMAGKNGVAVTLDPPGIAIIPVLNKGEFHEFSTGGSFHVTATGPVLVGHYLQGSNYPGHMNGCFATGIGDPSFTLVPPVPRFLQEYTLFTPAGYEKDYINITFKVGTETGVTIDGKPFIELLAPSSVTATPVGGSGWATVALPIGDGVHTLASSSPVGVTAYGYDCDVSYAHPVGLRLKVIP